MADSRAGSSRSDAVDFSFYTTGKLLWCEFEDLTGCKATFSAREYDAWVQHVREHIGDPLPDCFMCWFCDGKSFNAQENTAAARVDNLENRMRHIFDAHVMGRFTGREAMREDFHAISAAYRNGRLTKEEYGLAYASELPEEFRLPGVPRGSGASPAAAGAAAGEEYRATRSVAISTANEDRERRRRQETAKDGKDKGKERARR